MATKSYKKVGKKERIDLDMTMGLIGNALLSNNGLAQMKNMMGKAKDPSAVLGQMAYQAIAAARDKLMQKGIDISPKIWVARGGVVDQTIAEAAKVIAGVGKSPQILNRNVLEGSREHVLEAMHQEDKQNGLPGNPDHPDNTGDADDSADVADAETPEDEADENAPYQGVMPAGEAGGSHGPNRMPAPTGLLAGAA